MPSSFVAAPSRRDRILVTSCIILLTALAWLYLSRLDHTMMAWSARDLIFTFAMWAIMMVGMMTPSAAPVLLLFAGTRRTRPGGPLAVLCFGLGYITIWIAFALGAATVQSILHHTALWSPMMATSSTRLGGAILIGAGVYQWTPLKGSCLRHCHSPLGFLMNHWRDGAGGAYRMGFRHGAFCLGCCWALMGVLFVVGVMNLVWVAVLAVFIFVEKLAANTVPIARVGGFTLIALGILRVAGVL